MALSKKTNFQIEVQKSIRNSTVYTYRERVAIASINAGTAYTLLPAIRNFKYRIIDITICAIGGTTAGGTDVRIKATQGGSTVDLIVVALAQLARSVLNRLGVGTQTILADGASKADCDVNTAVNAFATGTFSGNTHFDIELTYTLEKV